MKKLLQPHKLALLSGLLTLLLGLQSCASRNCHCPHVSKIIHSSTLSGRS